MDLPANPSLPFFSYGLFRPGQIGYGQIRGFVLASESGWWTRAELLERDGLPLIAEGQDLVKGWLIRFDTGRSVDAYSLINSIEPDKLYFWKPAKVEKDGREEEANVLFGRKPRKGSVHPEYEIWEGDKEPLFTTALTVVKKTIDQYKNFDWNLEHFFQLQMAYLLLWCSIERFVSFKYHLGSRATDKVYKLSEDPVFAAALRDRVSERRQVFRSDEPEKKESLDRDDARKALAYYYQVRSNITHRGKTAFRDHDMLLKSLTELFDIFKQVLHAEFSNPPVPCGEDGDTSIPPAERVG